MSALLHVLGLWCLGLPVLALQSIPVSPSPTPTARTATTTTTTTNILPICGSESSAANARISSPHLRLRYQPSHIGVLPGPGQTARLVLTENGTLPTQPAPTSPPPEAVGVGVDYPTEDVSLSPTYCSIKLEACASCTIELQFEPSGNHLNDVEMDKLSKCDASERPCFDLEMVEERAEQSVPFLAALAGAPDVHARTSIWTSPARTTFLSSGNSLLVVVAVRHVEADPRLALFLGKLFPITVRVHDNTQVIHGQPSESIFLANQTSIGFVESPRYPDAYPRTLVKNYTLVNHNRHGFVRLQFDDFHVHFQSELQVIDSDGSELFNTRTEYRRPPAIQSRGPKLTVLFHARDFTQVVGFRARYEFVENALWPDKPSRRNCDDYLEGYGGRITLDSQRTLAGKYVDCIWLIGRFPALSRTFDKIYLKVEEFRPQGVGLRLEVRRGASSSAERVLMLFDEHSPAQLEHKQPLEGFATEDPLQPAFYVRLRGYLGAPGGVALVYAQFYRWATALCPGGEGEFHCDNSKCIKASLRCDGIDHCGDASDEVCHVREGAYEATHIDIAGALTLVIGAVGVVILLLTVVAILSRLYRNRLLGSGRRPRTTPSSSGTSASGGQMAHEAFCNELAPSIQTIGERRFYVLPEGQISVIEAPPTYDDAMKHPAVPVRPRSVGGYANEAFRRSRAPSPSEPPPPLPEDVARPKPGTPCPSRSHAIPAVLSPSASRAASVPRGSGSAPASPSPPGSPCTLRRTRSRSAGCPTDDESWV